METEASQFESSEMLASFFSSTPLITDSWKLCNQAYLSSPSPCNFIHQQIGNTSYVAFSGIDLVTGTTATNDSSGGNLVPLFQLYNGHEIFSGLLYNQSDLDDDEDDEVVMVHSGFLRVFLDVFCNPTFQNQMSTIIQQSRAIVITGHSIGGTIASLCSLWLLSYVHSTSKDLSVLCITFGSPLLGNQSLSRAILRQRWGGNFCHIVSKHDIVPRLLFAPLSPLAPQLQILLQFWQLSMTSPQFGSLDAQLPNENKAEIFRNVLGSLEGLANTEEGSKIRGCFWPFGNFLFCSEDGAICIENAKCVISMMHLLFASSSPECSIEDHVKYGYYMGKLSLQFLNKKNFLPVQLPESSSEAGLALALHSSGITFQEPIARRAEECLKLARPTGRPPSLICANLAIKLSQITPYRAQIEWYKQSCDMSDDQMGYYDAFKLRGASKKDSKINMNRHKLAQFWDSVIKLLENNQLPHDFQRRAKWVNASQFYKLLVEPLDIAEYYRTGMHLSKGHYIQNGRERRYQIFDRWWKDRPVKEEDLNTRSKYASLTQDTLFWAKVEEARESLDKVRSENDPANLNLLWTKIDEFERYARELVDRKEVSKDVIARNSSYCLWLKDYNELKSQLAKLRPRFPSFLNGEVVP